jgi:hypothetical protein
LLHGILVESVKPLSYNYTELNLTIAINETGSASGLNSRCGCASGAAKASSCSHSCHAAVVGRKPENCISCHTRHAAGRAYGGEEGWKVEVILNYTKGERNLIFAKAEKDNSTLFVLTEFLNGTEYAILVRTLLVPSENCSVNYFRLAESIVEYIPRNGEVLLLGDHVSINGTTTLSGMYRALAKTLTHFAARVYDSSENATLKELGRRYHRVAAELETLASLVERKLSDHNWNIEISAAVILDYSWSCLLCVAGCVVCVWAACYACCEATVFCCYCWYLIEYEVAVEVICHFICEQLGLCP